jgi:DNA (cytosine-5)-methyltransferase 1
MFNVISTFSGCGGSSLGYKMAGGNVLLSIENNANAAATYRENFPDTILIEKSIYDVSVDEVLTKTNIKPYELGILDGSPPCQGFSVSGKRDLNDNRNQLYKEYIRLLKGLQPKCFVMENVAGMVQGNMKFVFVEILKELKEAGYNVSVKLLNTKNYEVPQSRPRLIFIGVRSDLDIEPSHPGPLKNIITVARAFKGCSDGERLTPTNTMTILAPKMRQGEKASKHHPKGSFFSSHRLCWDKPAPTILKTIESSVAIVLHPEKDESISIEELKRLFTFPDDFKLIGSFKEKWARLGNCVPPMFMKHIASHINKNILQA